MSRHWRRVSAIMFVGLAAGIAGAVWIAQAPNDAARQSAAPVRAHSERAHVALVAKSLSGPTTDPTSPLAIRGLAYLLPQYPSPALATSGDRAAAKRLFAELVSAARAWRTPAEARAAGYDTSKAQRRGDDASVHYLHAEHHGHGTDPRRLDPRRPKALIYANAPGRSLVLVGVMFSMPRGVHGPDPAGPISRWHWHQVCAKGNQRGLKPRADGSCPPGSQLRAGSEMMHIWFTADLRSAFAIHAPEPELCAAGLLPAGYCKHVRGTHGM